MIKEKYAYKKPVRFMLQVFYFYKKKYGIIRYDQQG